MDFSRWGLPGFHKFSSWSARYRNFQEFLGEILESDRGLLSEKGQGEHDATPRFAVRDDIESLQLSPVPSRGRSSLKIDSLFAELAPYFEAGFLFFDAESHPSKTDGAGTSEEELRSMFLFGRVFVPQGAEPTKVAARLPASGFEGVLRGRARPILQALQLDAIHDLHQTTAFAISPQKGVVICLLCNRPHPWQVGTLEKTYFLLKG